jgi:hypothetical protein
MTKQRKILEAETELLEEHIIELYQEFFDKIEELKKNVNETNIYLIESEYDALTTKLQILLNDYKILCMKTLL